MYIGRFVVAGRSANGLWYLGYRVSSRSFPNRFIKLYEDRAAVLPTADAAQSDNPYIAYNCCRVLGKLAVVGNGSQVDPIIDKLALGYPLRDALVMSLLALDFERDTYNTPRVAAALDLGEESAWLAFIGKEKLFCRKLIIEPGQAWLVSTYECTEPTEIMVKGEDPDALAEALFACEYEHPVAAMAVAWVGTYRMAARSAG